MSSSLGKSIPRSDGIAKVTGRAIYASDVQRPNALVGRLLLSDRPHARILSINTSKAVALPGVKAVVSGADTPDIRYGLIIRDRYILPKCVVRYIGEPIAAVAAENDDIAREGIDLIDVEYENLTPIFSPEEALLNHSPILHPEFADYYGPPLYIRYGNVCMDAILTIGDVRNGFDQADLIVEDTYHTSPEYQAYLEPHACLAEVDHDGRLTVWTGEQLLSPIHEEIAAALQLPMNRVKVLPLELGGGFGGKLTAHLEEICALLAIVAKRPVKICLSREQDFLTTHLRSPFTFHLKSGVKNDGTIVAREVDILTDVGAYSDYAVATGQTALGLSRGVYKIPNFSARARAVYTNNPDFGCMRGFGGLEMNYANECHIDSIAQELGMDPADLRIQNLVQEGDPMATGQPMHSVSIHKLMKTVLRQSDYRNRKVHRPENHGIGIANSIITTGIFSSSAIVHILSDGTINIQTGVVDIGTGTHTALCQIAAEAFQVDMSAIHLASLDSDNSPYDAGSTTSRTVFDSGNAVLLACLDARDQLLKIAAQIFRCRIDDVIWQDGKAIYLLDQSQSLSMCDLVGNALYLSTGPVIGRGALLSTRPFTTTPGNGYAENPCREFLFASHVVEVEIDPETGECHILNYTACHDAGTIVNPRGIEGQIEGGIVQGIGYALYENLVIDHGRIMNPEFSGYLIPTVLDIPQLKSFLIETKSTSGPFGAKGIGEPPMMPPIPAIANAIRDATGVNLLEIPMTSEKIFFAIKNYGRNTQSNRNSIV
jgi:CO/xanthine dehydrogenase Mo-binding subunit